MFVLILTLISLINAQFQNLAPRGLISASTSGTFSLATDGNKFPGIIENNFAQCAFTKGINNTQPWWQVDLLNPKFKVGKVIIYTNMSKKTEFIVTVGNTKLNEDELMPDIKFNPSFRVCSNISKHIYRLHPEAIEINCHHIFAGSFVTILSQNTQTLIMCRVDIFGDNGVNIALGKATRESSSVECAKNVDEMSSNPISPANINATQCTFTSEQKRDQYPWWRVDLVSMYMIDKIRIHNLGGDQETLMHDIEIRVGLNDITHRSKRRKLFNSNPLCASFIDKYLPAGWIQVHCPQTLFGRYVSIQVVKLCDMWYCANTTLNKKSVLSLRKVEVFGYKVKKDLYPLSEISLNKPNYFQVTSTKNELNDNSFTYTIDLQSTDIVDHIEIAEDANFPSNNIIMFSKLIIQVGNTPSNLKNNAKRFYKENLLCKSIYNITFQPGKGAEIKCYHPLSGRYVVFKCTYLCHPNQCSENFKHLSKSFKVLGYKFNNFKPVFNAANKKPSTQSLTLLSGKSSLAVDRWLPDMTGSNKCTLSEAHHKPWWVISLDKVYVIAFVLVYLPFVGELDPNFIEIRVGRFDVSNKKLFAITANEKCSILIYHDKILECPAYRLGRYVSVENLHVVFGYMNILQLCEVEVYKF